MADGHALCHHIVDRRNVDREYLASAYRELHMSETGKKRPARPRRAVGKEQGRPASPGGERIARRLARAGIASRREAETMIAAGRVSVNGKVLQSPAVNVTDKDVIRVDGELLPQRERTRLFLFHKPAGTITSDRDPEGRRTIFDLLPEGLPRLVTVGRLDYATEGLLLLTNDGGLARVLELPSTGWLRRYRVRVHGQVDPAALEELRNGISVDGVLYGAIEATLDRKQGSNAWLTVALREGKNREVRNVLGALGLQVARLIRISYGPFQLAELPEGQIVEVRGRTLRDQLGPRLIAEAGADFDAPVRNVPKGPAPRPAEAPAGARSAPLTREKALERLRTRPEPRGKDARRPGAGRKQDPAEELRTRTANVWRAPDARPLGPSGLKQKKGKPAPKRPGKHNGPARRKGGSHADRRR
jgi:23S rRNA pseudouridine2605 synthase